MRPCAERASDVVKTTCTILLVLGALVSVAEAQLAALTAPQRLIAESIPEGHGEAVDRAYVVSNEWGHRVYFEHIAGVGGAHVGVGADQNYTMAAASGAEMIFIIDYDPTIPRVHRMYTALLREAADPDQLLAMFGDGEEARAVQVLEAGLEGVADRDDVVRLYRRYRARLLPYLRNLRTFRHGRTWLNDAAMFAHVRALHLGGRVVARTGDVTEATTLVRIGLAARQLHVTVRTVYLSNAEMFFPNRPQVLANMRVLPTDHQTLLLRTVFHRSLPLVRFCRWHYVIEPFPDYLARLESGRYFSANSFGEDVLRAPRRPGPEAGVTVLDATVPMRAE